MPWHGVLLGACSAVYMKDQVGCDGREVYLDSREAPALDAPWTLCPRQPDYETCV